MSSLRVLLNRLIDYAGLFPPAELAMRPAVQNYRQYLEEPSRWMLGRFIVPASRLPEFAIELHTQSSRTRGIEPWLISALISPTSLPDRFEADLRSIAEFHRRQPSEPLAVVDTVEGKATTQDEILDAISLVPQSLELFLELPVQPNLDDLLTELGTAQLTRRALAKIRTGGVVAEAIPSADRVAAFMSGCAANQIGFKATAGLHHAIRGTYRLTYCDGSPSAVMYGFLNMFVAALAAFDDPRDVKRIEAILLETDITQFRFDNDSIGWKNSTWSTEKIRQVREYAIAFGSCSFVEPLDELRSLHLFPN